MLPQEETDKKRRRTPWMKNEEKQRESPILHNSCVTGGHDTVSLSVDTSSHMIEDWFLVKTFSPSDCSAQGLLLFHSCSCIQIHLFLPFCTFFHSFSHSESIWFEFDLSPLLCLCFVCILQPLFFVCYSDCNKTRRPDRCHVDLIATATSKEHRSQLLWGRNQGCVSLRLSGFCSTPCFLYTHAYICFQCIPSVSAPHMTWCDCW